MSLVTTDDNGRITRLDLRWRNWFGRLPAELGNLSKLTHLYLGAGNRFYGTIPAELGNLSNLTHLYLGCNTADDEIQECHYFTGCIPAGWSNVPNSDLSDSGWGGLAFCN